MADTDRPLLPPPDIVVIMEPIGPVDTAKPPEQPERPRSGMQ